MAYDTTKLVKLAALKALAEKVKADYAKQADLTALKEQVEGLVTAGGEPNVLEGVKVNGTTLDIADKMVDILVATGTANGTLAVNNVDVAVKGLAALAYKAQISETDLDAALKAVLDAKASGADVTTLIGSDTGKSVRTIANEELAAQLIPEGAKDSLNTLQEIADWIQGHPDDASAMNTAITKLQAIVAGIGGEEDDYATVTAALEGKIAEALTGISEGATKVEKSETNGNIKNQRQRDRRLYAPGKGRRRSRLRQGRQRRTGARCPGGGHYKSRYHRARHPRTGYHLRSGCRRWRERPDDWYRQGKAGRDELSQKTRKSPRC